MISIHTTITQKELLSALKKISKFVPRRPFGASESVLLHPQEGYLALRYVDLNGTSLEINVSAHNDENQDDYLNGISLPVKSLLEIVQLMPGDITIQTTGDSKTVSVISGTKSVSLRGGHAADYPSLPTPSAGRFNVLIDAHTLKKVIETVKVSLSTEDTRPVLTGIFLRVTGDQATFVTADGFRLTAMQSIPVTRGTESNEFEVILPAKPLLELVSFLGTSPAVFTLNDRYMEIMLPAVTMFIAPIQGTYPRWEQLIPDGWEALVTMDRRRLIQEIKAASILAKKGSNIVRFHFEQNGESTKGTVKVASRAEGEGEFSSTFPTHHLGSDISIAFNFKYLMEALKTMDGEAVFSLKGSSSPLLLKEEGIPSTLHVIMPMFVQW